MRKAPPPRNISRVRPIATLPAAEARALDGVVFDLDDTLLTHGELSEAAYSALHGLRGADLQLIAATGRPAAWGAVLAGQWPVAAVVTENGAVAWHRQGGRLTRLDTVDEAARRQRRARLTELVEELRGVLPELALSDDAEGRRSDLTLDIGEHRTVSESVIATVLATARARGVRAFRSSIHLHLTLDGDDKASGTVRTLHQLLGVDPTRALARFAFIGDSENDASCFAAFRTTIAVANVTGRPTVPPRYRTLAARGEGFAEAAATLIARRRDPAVA